MLSPEPRMYNVYFVAQALTKNLCDRTQYYNFPQNRLFNNFTALLISVTFL